MSEMIEATTGRLTTHVLDTAKGQPAAGLTIQLFRMDGDAATAITTIETNADGRSNAPLLSGETIEAGTYQLVFHAGDYFRAQGVELAEPIFLDQVPVRFGIADPSKHYHVPLLLSPFGYSTYRGS